MNVRDPLLQIAARRGTIDAQRRQCGRPTCRCRRGHPHVAHYLFTREQGRLLKRYVKAT